jgi:hypothetical protein
MECVWYTLCAPAEQGVVGAFGAPASRQQTHHAMLTCRRSAHCVERLDVKHLMLKYGGLSQIWGLWLGERDAPALHHQSRWDWAWQVDWVRSKT